MTRSIELDPHPRLRVAVVEAAVAIGPSPPELVALLAEGAPGVPPPFDRPRAERQPVYDAVRRMLRHAGHKPSGRGKPASEYLAAAAERDGAVRTISNVVDVNNAVSLHSGLPISVLDAGELRGALRVAPGGDDEAYVFNPSGQEIRLRGLVTVYHRPGGAWAPAGNPVRDSMATKVGDDTDAVVAVLYSDVDLGDAYPTAAARWYAELLERFCDATSIEVTATTTPPPRAAGRSR